MTNHYYDEHVSIDKKPAFDAAHRANLHAKITIGDMHGCTLKFLYFLVRHGFIKHISDADYNELAHIFLKNAGDITAIDITRVDQILHSLSLNNEAMFHLLGDEVCDRMCNDYFTLCLFQTLRQHVVPGENVLSNHGAEFIIAYETKKKFLASVMDPHHVYSMTNLQILLAKNLVSRDEIISMIDKAYKPYCKLLSYSLGSDKKSITLFTHAPTDVSIVKALADKFNVAYHDHSPAELAKTIHRINHQFQKHIMNNSLHTLINLSVMHDGYSDTPIDMNKHPIEFLIWNRELTILNRDEEYKGCKISYVHGHDRRMEDKLNVIVLDNYLGKNIKEMEGLYSIVYSHERKLEKKHRKHQFFSDDAAKKRDSTKLPSQPPSLTI